MKIPFAKRGLAALLGLVLAVQPLAPGLLGAYAYTGSATVKAATLNVRSGAGTNYQAVGSLSAGTTVSIRSEQTGTDGNLWYQIQFTDKNGSLQTGYVSAAYVNIPVAYTTDAEFEAYLNSQGFPESYKDGLRQMHAQYPNWVFKAVKTGLDWNTVIENESITPRNLVSTGSISSWKSLASGAYDWGTSTWTGFDGSSWVAASSEIIAYYMDPRNFLDSTYVFQFLSQEYNGQTQTREGLVSMLEGTFLSGSVASSGSTGSSGSSSGPGASSSAGSQSASGSDDSNSGPGVYGPGAAQSTQSSSQSGSSSGSPSVSLEGPMASITPKERQLVGTEIISLESPGQTQSETASAGPGASSSSGETSSSSPEQSQTISYVDIIMNAGQQSGVNPYVLAAMILQEQGAGTSDLISGTNSQYPGYYNFFNVEAYQSGSMSAVERGLWYASQSGSYGRPWNTQEKSILGGAQNYAENYVKAGQNTFYLKKFNVQGSNLYKHQYMSNVQGAASEGAKLAMAYTDSMKNSALEFLIPVYDNMPDQACQAPVTDGSPNNKLSSLSAEGYSLTPSFSRDTESYNLIVDTSVTSVNIQASAIDSEASVTGTGTVSLSDGVTDIAVTVTAGNGSTRTYTIHVAKQSGGPVGSQGSSTSPAGSSGSSDSSGPSSSGGPGVDSNSSGPGGSNVTIVTVGQ